MAHSTLVNSIVQQLNHAANKYENNEAGSREALIEHSRALVAAVELPSEFIQYTFWAQPALAAIIKLSMDVQLFQHLQDAGQSGLTVEVLASKTGVDPRILRRLARQLVTMNVITLQDGAFRRTSLSDSLVIENFHNAVRVCHDITTPGFHLIPSFFEKHGYEAPPADGTLAPFQDILKTDQTWLQWIRSTPKYDKYFASFLSVYRVGKASWCDPGFYPVAERLIAGFDAAVSDVLLVDVGGGRGHDLAYFAAKFGAHPGRLVLHDRPEVLGGSIVGEDLDPRPFELQPHDIFTPEPVRGARAYYMHSVPHGLSDELAVTVIRSLVPALVRGYSRVLINEIVLEEENPTLAATNMDMAMLVHMGEGERYETEWRAIIAQAGLKVVKIYSQPGVAESLIEAELA